MIYLAPSKLNLKPSEITRDINIDEIPMYWYNIFTTNCYAYALGLDVAESSIAECAYQPGVMGSVIFNYPLINLKNMSTEEKVFLDMEALKIRIKEANPSDNGDYRLFHKKDNETVSSISFSWIISLYENENDLNDFHFARKTDNGIWYHKEGYNNKPTSYDYDKNRIIDPRNCNLGDYKYKKSFKLSLNREC